MHYFMSTPYLFEIEILIDDAVIFNTVIPSVGRTIEEVIG